MAGSLLDVSGLHSGFALGNRQFSQVLRGVSLRVGKGEIVGLVGESGSGKSVTAKSVLRLLPRRYQVSAGTIVFDGTELLALDRKQMRKMRGRRIAYVAQEPMNALDPTARIAKQLGMILREHFGTSEREGRARAASVLHKMRVTDPERVLDAYPFQLSGGLRQRAALAMAFLCEPELLIADEPTTALDVTIQAEVLTILAERARDLAASVLFITHNMGVVWRLCDVTYVMRSGSIVESGVTRAVLTTPTSPYTAALLNALPERNAPRARIPVAS